MSEIFVYLRRNNGICMKVNVWPQLGLRKFISIVENILKLDCNKFKLLHNGFQLGNFLNERILLEEYVHSNSIIDVIQMRQKQPNLEQITILVHHEEQIYSLIVNIFEKFQSIRSRIADITTKFVGIFDMFYQDRLISNQNCLTPFDLKIREGDKIMIKDKKTKLAMREVESVASSSQNKPQNRQNNFRQLLRVKKKNSCMISLHEKQDLGSVKKSAIEPRTLTFQENLNNNNNHKKLQDILNAKETKSYGSLESLKPDQYYIVLTNIQQTKFYRFMCQPGCTGGAIRAKLAKLEKIPFEQLLIEEIEDNDCLQQLFQDGMKEDPRLIFRIISKL